MKKLFTCLAVLAFLLPALNVKAQAPTITSFAPLNGPVGTLVTITGTNLSNPTLLTIGGRTAIVISNDGTSMVGMVMPGAVTGAVSVTTAGGTVNGTGNFTPTATPYPSVQQGNKLVGTAGSSTAYQGYSVSLSADGNTAIVGGYLDASQGAAWIYTRSGNAWVQQGNKLVGTGGAGGASQGYSVSMSADGNTAVIGGSNDSGGQGAAWIFTRSGSTWSQQGNKLVGTGGIGPLMRQGYSVSLSADGNTVILGAPLDNDSKGAAWIFTRSGSTWTQQGNKLVGTGGAGDTRQGYSVSLSADGNTAILGGPLDNFEQGAAWVFTRNGSTWSQQGNKLVGTGNIGAANQGQSVSLSADGNTAIVGGYFDNNLQGAAWVFTRSGSTWTQQGNKLVGTGNTGVAFQGQAVSLSADGNTAIVGGNVDNGALGAVWVFTRSGSTWTQQGSKLVGTGSVDAAEQGRSVSLSADGSTAIVGGNADNGSQGAAWVFANVPPGVLATVTTIGSSAIGATTATLDGRVNDEGGVAVTERGFVYSLSANPTTSDSKVLSGSGGGSFSQNVTGLNAATTYHFRAYAINSIGTSYGSDLSFITLSPPSPPTISSFIPARGAAGETVVITGTNFNTAPANNIVFFGATRATVSAATSTELTVTVPAGATHAAITVLNTGTGLAAYSRTFFLPTFTPNKGSITTADLAPKINLPTGDNPYAVAIGDLDGDGKPDLALANILGNSVSVMLNTGNPGSLSFAPRVDLTTANQPITIAVGDIDGDGRLDIATGNGSNTLSVLRNLSSPGAVSFDTNTDLAASNVNGVAISDIDGDGKLDLLTANSGDAYVSVFRNTGSSGMISFAGKIDFATSPGPGSVTVGDIDGDGKADVITTSNDNKISILRNNSSPGSLAFDANVDLPVPNAAAVAVGDIDGDGMLDVAAVNFGGYVGVPPPSGSIIVYRNTGAPGAISFSFGTSAPTGMMANSIAISDIDGDGKADLAVANAGTVSVLRNTTTPLNFSFNTKVDFSIDGGNEHVRIGDLDGDGKPDLVIVNPFSNTISLFRNAPQYPPAITSFSPSSGPVGTLVTITGTGLTAPTAFTIGGITALVVSNTGNQLTGFVMPGTATGNISFTTAAGTTTSGSNFTVTPTPRPGTQQGNKLVGAGNTGASQQGFSVALSADGNTAIVGGLEDDGGQGAAWIYTRSGSNWVQQGIKLVGTGAIGTSRQGRSVALSADGNTAMVGGYGDNGNQGAAWVFTRSGSAWTQQGAKLVGTGNTGAASQGFSVSLSADGNTAIIGGHGDNGSKGAAWIFSRNAGVWAQQGTKLVGTGSIGSFPQQGISVSMSADGNTAAVGANNEGGTGAMWVFVRSGDTWTQQGNKLVGTGSSTPASQGYSLALSADGNTAILGGFQDNNQGAAWVFTRSGGTWTQQGAKLVGTGSTGFPQQGRSVSLSADGNTAIVGGYFDNSGQGAIWVYTRSAGTWTQSGSKLLGTGNTGAANRGQSVAVSADGSTAIVGGNADDSNVGAIWAYIMPSANADLSALTTTAGTITPAFSPATTTYTANVAYPTTSVTVTPVLADLAATVKINGTTVTSGSPSGNIALAVGPNVITTEVSAQDGTTIKTYTITVTRAAPPPPAISSFTPSSGPIGTLVTITGNNLDNPTAFSIGGVTALVVKNTGTQLTGFVMPGAVTGSISLTTLGGADTHGSNFSVTQALRPAVQQGNKLVGTNASGAASQGVAVAVSADGNTAIVGGYQDNSNTGAAWIYTRSGGTWVQEGGKLVGTGASGLAQQGWSVALNADGNTAMVGGFSDNSNKGAVWIFTRIGSTWTQQGGKLTVADNTGNAQLGRSVSLSADGNTAVVGGSDDNSGQGAAWIFTRSGITWTQQGNKLVGSGVSFNSLSGYAVSISADGNTAIVGGYNGDSAQGAAWVYTRTGNTWSQQGNKLMATGNIGGAQVGRSVSLSADGNTAILGGWTDNSNQGAVWIFTRSGTVWAQQAKLFGTGASGIAHQGWSSSLSADGNTAVVGGMRDNNYQGAVWVYTRTGSTWTQRGNKLLGAGATGSFGQLGYSISVSADGSTAIVGGSGDNGSQGAAWAYTVAPPNADLSALTTTAGSITPAFDPAATAYTANVPNTTTSVTITPTAADVAATIQVRVNGGAYTPVTGGSPTGALALNVGSNTIDVQVTAQDGTTIKIYTVTVTRAPSSEASLASLALSSGSLSPAFASGTYSYTASVSDVTSSVTVTPTVTEPNATVKVNGVTVASGNASTSIPLTVGSNNVITTVVTAQNGTTIQTYTVTVTRAVPPLPYSESFRYSTASNMIYGGTPGASLTGGGADAEGAGYLRLTNNGASQNGFARNTTAFPSANGLSVSFEYYTHSGSGGDGLTFFLYDATANPFQVGAFGGSLGYAQTTNSGGLPGVSKGYIGIGLDEFGNFSNPTAGRQGGPGLKASSVTLRGDGDGIATTAANYEYLTGIQTSDATAMSAAGAGSNFAIAGMVNGRTGISTGRPQGGLTPTNNGYRKAKIELVPNGLNTGYTVNVWITEGNAGGGILHHVVTDYPYVGSTLPAFLSYGFAASTGGSNNFHEVRNLDITVPTGGSALAPTVTDITKTGSENVIVPFTASDFTSKFSSPAGNSLAKIKVLTLPANGTLKLSGSAIILNQEITAANLSSITFVPGSSFNGSTAFNWNGSDGILYAAVHAYVNITLAPAGTTAFPYSEGFKNSTASGLVTGGTASLTANGPDFNGTGYLRLTNNTASQLGFARNTTAFPSDDGFSVSFEYYTYGGTGADGISFFLYDAAANGAFTIGATGGSLGYAQNTTLPGVSKGYIGFGFDEGGGFSNPVSGRVGGPGSKPSSVTIRGDGNGTGGGSGINYEYLTNIQTTNAGAMTAAGAGATFQAAGGVNGRTGGTDGLTPTSAGYRKAKIVLTPNGTGFGFIVNVWITEGNTGGPIEHHVVTDYNYVSTSITPMNLSYGFAGANGGSTNFHEIRNLDITIPGGININEIMAVDRGIPGNDLLTIWSGNKTGTQDIASPQPQLSPVDKSFPNASNILSPNNDGKNDTWVIKNLDKYPHNKVTILDRNGKVIFTKENYRNEWDGTFHGTILKEDTYYYIVEFGKGISPLKGFISIVR